MSEEAAHTEWLLATMRAASLRCKLWDAEITSIGVSLKNDLIGPDMAVKWLHDQGLLWLVEPLPGTVGQVALQNLPVEER